MATSSIHNGWHYDPANSRLDFYYRGTRVGDLTSSGLNTTGALTVASGGVNITAGGLLLGTGANRLGLGAPEAVTIATGVATITKPYVHLTGEGATNDQLDTITYTSAASGDILILSTALTDTLTVDDANIDLGATSRAIAAPGTNLLLLFDGTSWGEIAFIVGNNA